MSRRDMFTSVLVRELHDVYLKTSRHTYDIGIIVDLTPVSDGPHASTQSGQCEYVLGETTNREKIILDTYMNI